MAARPSPRVSLAVTVPVWCIAQNGMHGTWWMAVSATVAHRQRRRAQHLHGIPRPAYTSTPRRDRRYLAGSPRRGRAAGEGPPGIATWPRRGCAPCLSNRAQRMACPVGEGWRTGSPLVRVRRDPRTRRRPALDRGRDRPRRGRAGARIHDRRVALTRSWHSSPRCVDHLRYSRTRYRPSRRSDHHGRTLGDHDGSLLAGE